MNDIKDITGVFLLFCGTKGSENEVAQQQRLNKKNKSVEGVRSTNSKERIKAVDDFIDAMSEKWKDFTPSEKVKILTILEVGEEFFTCQYCGEVYKKDDFYRSTEPYNKTKVSRACKKCAAEFAYPTMNGVPQKPTRDSIKRACFILNKPFIEKVYEASVQSINNENRKKKVEDAWKEYVKNIGLPAYSTFDYFDSDDYTNSKHSLDILISDGTEADKIIMEEYEQNRKDTIRLLGYDPFLNESELDKPYMYSDLIGYLDNEDGDNIDRMKLSSIIEIIKGFSHRDKLNDIIASYLRDKENLNKNLSTIKSIEETKKNIGIDIKTLASESKISLSSNKTANKEASTFTGKLKMLKEKRLREQEENVYDFKTCEGIRQVAECSADGLLNRLAIDEAISADIIIDQRRMLSKFKYAFEDANEKARLLFRENQDLKERLSEIDPSYENSLEELPYEYQVREKDEFDELVDKIRNYKAIDMEILQEEEEDYDEELDETDDGDDDE